MAVGFDFDLLPESRLGPDALGLVEVGVLAPDEGFEDLALASAV